jgi:hypothetical protein
MSNPKPTSRSAPDLRVLADDELDAVNGAKGGQKQGEYLVIRLKEVLISSVLPSS